jgi:hypothetical protein
VTKLTFKVGQEQLSAAEKKERERIARERD